MITGISDAAILHNGVAMPWLGLGVFKAEDGKEVEQAIHWAIEAGYRHIDTAAIYQNEEGTGKAIRECGVPRDEIFLTTKVWNADQGYDSTLKAFDASLGRLGLDGVDLYLIHWPVKGKYKETWRALEKIYQDGRAKSIGVSNFHIHHLKDILADCEVAPMVNQVEFHPYLQQPDLVGFCKEKHIVFEAWSPIMRGDAAEVPALAEIGKKYGKSAVQVVLRWDLQKGIVTIPKSVKQQRIVDNANIFDFTLDAEDMAAIDALDKNERMGPDPDNFNF
jgi:methylglyoxal/glyoxal reductase